MPSFVSNTSARRLVRQDEARKLRPDCHHRHSCSAAGYLELFAEGCDQRHSAGSVGARVDRAVLSSPAGQFADISRYRQTDTLVSALQFAQVSFSYPPYSEDNSTTLSQVVFARSRSHGPSLDPPQYTALRIAPAELALLRTQPATPSALRVAKPTAVESLVRNSYEIISIS